jgi:hypothetical protein
MAAKDFKPSNMVMVAKLDCKVNVKSLYDCLSVVPLTEDFNIKMFTNNNKVKIPYFGIDKILISVRYYNQSKGFKRDTNPRMNAVFIDLQHSGKNIHVKISQDYIQMTGILSDEMGLSAVDTILDHIAMQYHNLNYMNSIPSDIRINTANWVLQKIHTHITNINIIDRLPILTVEEVDIPHQIDKQLAIFFLTHSYGLNNYDEFYSLIQRLLGDILIYTGKLSIKKINVVNSIYNYNLGISLKGSLISLGKYLSENDNFEISMANWVDRKLQVKMTKNFTSLDQSPTIPLLLNNEEENVDLHNHTITIYQKGSIKQNSPTSTIEAYGVYVTIMEAIKTYLAISLNSVNFETTN